jgi:tetratricopeptide (TPR) repeat protein
MIFASLLLAIAMQSASPGIYEPAPIMIPGRDDVPEKTSNAGTTSSALLAACLKQANDDPAAATKTALDWIGRGGDWSARQCLGFAYAQGGDYATATGVFARAASEADVARDPGAASVWALAGNAALANGDARTAIQYFDAALARAALTGLALGEVHIDRARARVVTGDLAGASSDLERARGDATADPLTWLLSATLARRQENLSEAATYIAEAARLAPTDPAVMLEAGNIAVLSGQEAAARANWQSVVAAAPQSAEADSARANLSQLAAADGSAPASERPPSPQSR